MHRVPRDWGKLHNEELYYVFSSRNVRWVSRLRRVRWVGYVARMGDRSGAYRDLVWGDLMQRDHVEGLGLGARVILKFVFKNW